MFDEIPVPSKERASRKQAWFWIGLSVLWLAIGADKIARHRNFGGATVLAWTFCLLIWSWRLVASYRDDAQQKQIEKLNAQ